MNAVEHYHEGERLLVAASQREPSRFEQDTMVAFARAHFAAAQIGATLVVAKDLDWNDPDVQSLYGAVVLGRSS